MTSLKRTLTALITMILFGATVVAIEKSSSKKSSAQFEQEMIAGWRNARSEANAAHNFDVVISNLAAPAITLRPACYYPIQAIDIPGPVPVGQIALTFDDGPRRETTPRILDILKKYHIHATFFLVGENIDGNEDLLKRMVLEGHSLGNHSFSHPDFHGLTREQMVSQLTKTEKLIAPYRGSRAAVMRFPYGNSTCSGEDQAERMKYAIVGWDVDSCDWDFADPNHPGAASKECIDEPKELAQFQHDFPGWLDYQLAQTRGGVILNHDIHQWTVDHLEANILRWKKAGYKFVELDGGAFPALVRDYNFPGYSPKVTTSQVRTSQITTKITSKTQATSVR